MRAWVACAQHGERLDRLPCLRHLAACATRRATSSGRRRFGLLPTSWLPALERHRPRPVIILRRPVTANVSTPEAIRSDREMTAAILQETKAQDLSSPPTVPAAHGT